MVRGVAGWWLVCALGGVGCDDGAGGAPGAADGRGALDGALTDARLADARVADGGPADAEGPDARVAVQRPPAPANEGIFGFAHACVTLDVATFGDAHIRFIQAAGEVFTFEGEAAASAAHFRLQPTDLGTFLLYDAEGRYLTAETSEAGAVRFPRVATLESDISRVDDAFKSPAEWTLEVSVHDATRFQLRQYATGRLLTVGGLDEATDDAAIVTLYPAEGCADFPELSLDAAGAPGRTTWPDGDVYGIVETHAHLLTNFAFGGGGIFHGGPFHRLGVEHALGSCAPFHEADGRRDVVGYALEADAPPNELITALITGRTPEFNHHADGYPTFTDWPNSWKNLTHQAMYYKWLERAWLAGLRLFVQHATGNSVLCELVAGTRWQQVRYDCNDMVSVDRQIVEAYQMQRYVDAQNGGPGRGWFRVVTSPAEARQVIAEGKLAVLLGIEISNLFDCFITPEAGFPTCTPESVLAKLDHYHDLGVRAIFPVHKYDNGFSAGDGHRGIIELGNFINSGHWSNFTEDCPEVPITFDQGNVQFGGINRPRDDYFAPAPNDFSRFAGNPLATLLPHASTLQEPPLAGAYCQNAGLTALGEALLEGMMDRGMIVEVDHLPQRGAVRAYELLAERNYPPAATHGNNKGGLTYALGGISAGGLGRCADPADPQSMVHSLHDRVALIAEQGGYPAEGFGFDLNGFAHGPRPRFGPDARCGQPQESPVQYPFMSMDGAVTFTEPRLGERSVDFNTEGMLHIGLLPELIEDARRTGATEEDLEPLFRSAEGYLRMWARAEARGRGE